MDLNIFFSVLTLLGKPALTAYLLILITLTITTILFFIYLLVRFNLYSLIINYIFINLSTKICVRIRGYQATFLLLSIMLIGGERACGAGQVTHFYLADRYLAHKPKNYTEAERRSFMLGTLFPDIRYLAKIAREKTHEKNVTLEDVQQAASPFSAGMKFHSFVDLERIRLVREWKSLDVLLGEVKEHRIAFLKLLEDEILFDQTHFGDIAALFAQVLPEELASGIPPATVERWHHLLMGACMHKPSVLVARAASGGASAFGIPSAILQVWGRQLPLEASKQIMKDYVRKLTNEFQQMFQTFLRGQENHATAQEVH